MTGETKATIVGTLKPGNYIIINDRACIVKSTKSSKGRHGHAKVRLEAVGLIDGQKVEQVYPSHDKVAVPIIGKKSAQVLSINGNVANVMDTEDYETFDLKIPPELEGNVMEGGQIVYWNVMGTKIMKQTK